MEKRKSSIILGVVFLILAVNFIFVNSGFTWSSMMIPIAGVIILFSGILGIKKKSDSSDRNSTTKYYGSYKEVGSQNKRKQCVKCHRNIAKEFDYCPHCGASQKGTVICEYCGHENPASNALCENCNGFL